MAYCRNCGAKLADGAQFCTACGTPAAPQPQQQQQPPYGANQPPVESEIYFDPQDVQGNKVYAILAYFGILVLVPVFAAKGSKFARFHANQGLVLLICNVAYGMLRSILKNALYAVVPSGGVIDVLLSLVYLVFLALAVYGIINAARGKAKRLPVIGGFNIIK